MIKRHKISNIEFYKDRLDEYIDEKENLISYLNNRADRIIGTAREEAFEAALMAIITKSEHSIIVDCLKSANELGKMKFQSLLQPNQKVEASLFGEKISFIAEKTTDYIDDDTWSSAYHIAIILRDRNTIDLLKSVPIDIIKTADLKGNDFDYLTVEFLQGLYNDRVNIGDLLIKAIKASINALSQGTDRRMRYTEYIKIPELTLYRCFLDDENDEFNNELKKALKLHKNYWTSEKDLIDNEYGWISLPLIAASVIAYESKGFDIKVNSDYLPMWLVKGDF